MKKIVPFNNVLEFNTDVKEITAISLEHDINKSPDMISGVFYISGEYKITEGLIETEKFNFELPFDIALSNNYRTDSLLIDIDDFRYELISDKSLKVNIDLYIDGEIEETPESDVSLDFLDREPPEEIELTNELDIQEDSNALNDKSIFDDLEELEHTESLSEEESTSQNLSNDIETIEPERIDLLKEMLTDNKEENMPIDINNENINNNDNSNISIPNGEENYVTYRVYKVEESDTIDTILAKYNITKESLEDYNNIENIKSGDKLIIPTNEK